MVRVASSSRAFTLSDLGQSLLEAAHLFRELAQLLGDYLVVIHDEHDPAAVNQLLASHLRNEERELEAGGLN